MDVFQRWQRIVLLSILGYEAAGCLIGGVSLVASPDGRFMEMPVHIMNGVFRDFLIPGFILFGLGILNAFAFIRVKRRKSNDWFVAGLALGGLYIWFVVEIIILQVLHPLHLMWGLPVLLGWIVEIPLIASRHTTQRMRNGLLACGIVSSLWYAAINIVVPMFYNGYSVTALTVSELSAIDAPTRILWVLLVLPYPLLFAAFGWGLIQAAQTNRRLHVVGILTIVYSIMNFYWPPMHMREIIGAGNGTLTDTLHIAWAMMTLVFMMLIMGSGALAMGKRFRMYTIITWVVFLVCGILTFMESPGIKENLPTPYIGIWERINISAFMLWVIVLSKNLVKENQRTREPKNQRTREPKYQRTKN